MALRVLNSLGQARRVQQHYNHIRFDSPNKDLCPDVGIIAAETRSWYCME